MSIYVIYNKYIRFQADNSSFITTKNNKKTQKIVSFFDHNYHII